MKFVQLFLFGILLAIAAICESQTTECGKNEVYMECGEPCQTECPTLNEPCLINYIKCPDGCYCEKGYARKTTGGECIPIDECPPKMITCDASKCKCKKRCPINEEYKECGPSCQTECETLNEPCLIRHITCPSGCYCKEGYARQTKGGRCIPIQQCPSKVDKQCPLNEEYKECGPPCQTECETLNEECKIVNIKCPSGCYCKEGYAREPKTGKCIPIKECPPKQNKCPLNEEYKECGPACQTECATLNEECKIVNKKCPSGCYCKEGYARQTKGGKCIPIKQCPTKVKYDDEDKSSKETDSSGSDEWYDKNKTKKPKDEDKPKDPKDPKDNGKPKDPKDSKDKDKPKDPKDSKDKDKLKDPKDPKDKDKPKDPKDPKDNDKPKDPKDPKDKDKPKDPKDKNKIKDPADEETEAFNRAPKKFD